MHAILSFLSTVTLLAAFSESSRLMTMSSKYLGKSPVFVAGGSNGVGLEVVKQLSSMGTPVHVLARREVPESYHFVETQLHVWAAQTFQ